MERLPERELTVMQVIWNSEERISTSTILKEFRKIRQIALQPLQVHLFRLVEKGFLNREKTPNINFYTAKISQEEYYDYENDLIINALFGGNSKEFLIYVVKHRDIPQEEIDAIHRFSEII